MGPVLILRLKCTHVLDCQGLWGQQRRCIWLGDLVSKQLEPQHVLRENEVPVAESKVDRGTVGLKIATMART